MHKQEIIQPYEDIAKKYLAENRVTEIIFSRATYHICVLDRKNDDPSWAPPPFIQFDKNNQVRDCFCSCRTENAASCEHLATALLKVYNQSHQPLHLRYEHSFWKHLCFTFGKTYGFEHPIRSPKEGVYQLKEKQQILFSLSTDSERENKLFKDLFFHRAQETEETSLKFSNLPKQELEMWKQGRPSEEFRFELSTYSDIAKWMFLQQENEKNYQIKFHLKEKIPTKISLHFENVQLSFYLSLATLQAIIPHLNTIESPLKVHAAHQNLVEKIIYNHEEKSLTIFPKKKQDNDTEIQGKQLGDWLFHPKKGFFHLKKSSQYQQEETILSHHIDEQLENNSHFFKQYLKNASLEIRPITPRYLLHFDGDWNLHIQLYLFDPSDLTKPHSVFFGNWIYIENKGFYRLLESTFKQPALFIPKAKVSEFIHQYRPWFNNQKGFETHLATLQTQLSYHLNSYGQLIFTTQLLADDETSYDFGDWVYVLNQGFYTKARYNMPISHGQTILRKDISKFIRNNSVDLESVEHFFSDRCPIEKTSIQLKVNPDLQEIVVIPSYHFYPEYDPSHILILNEYTYVKDEGFYLIPSSLLLPKEFQKKQIVYPFDQIHFLTLQFNKIKPFISHIDKQLQPAKDFQLTLLSRKGPFFKLAYTQKGAMADVKSLFTYMRKKHPYFLSDIGLLSLSDARFSWINELKEEQVTEDGIELNALDIIRIEALDAAYTGFSESLSSQIYENVNISVPKLSGFKAKLRPYQQIGLEWLWKLYQYNLSGILCDDMGLGKTLQSIALIAAIKNQKESRPHPGFKIPKKKFLIVCPTSVIFHWQDKLKQFFPKLNVLTFYGLNRSLDRFQQKFDILLTSYGILRIDQKQISKFNFTLSIYDELQVAKNFRSQTYRALLKIPSKMKLGLTGTPIENNLRELKALIDLVVPTYLPDEEKFRDFFTNPIERDQDNQKASILKKMIEPFILRRKKEDVLMDLPKKTEQNSYCELAPDQAKLYQFILNQSREKLLQNLKDESQSISYIHVFALLNQLKQVCNHPKSVDFEKYHNYQSGKWDLFVELLNEARDSGQKVVVFSQYLKMLDLIQEHLKLNNIEYASIRGSTQNRHIQLRKFQEDPKCEVFVASLKAVGLGVDLTAASVVIHYDRWWNAARENQATDRVHRIGQQRGVQVFKLVTLNSLEENIDKIIARKGKLMEEVVGTSDEEQLKLFSRQDLIDILQSVHKNIYENA